MPDASKALSAGLDRESVDGHAEPQLEIRISATVPGMVPFGRRRSAVTAAS